MQAVTNDKGQKGFYDEASGFIGIDSLQQVTSPEGQKGYYSEKTGFIPAPDQQAQPQAPGKWKEAGGEQSGISKDAYLRSERIAQAFEPKQNETLGQSVLQAPLRTATAIKEGAGLGLDVIKRGFQAFDESTGEGVSREVQDLMQSSIGKLGKAAFDKGGQYWALFKRSYPTVATSLEAALNVGMLGGGILGAGKTAGGAAPAISRGAGAAAGALEKAGVAQVTKDTLEMVKRDFSTLSKKQKEAAMMSGQVEKPGVFKKTALKTTKQDEEIAKSLEGLVDKKKNAIENIESVRTKIADLGQQTQALPKENDRIFNNSQIRNVLKESKEDSSIIFAGDKIQEKAYNAVTDEFMRILAKKSNKLSSVLEARKEFDNVVKTKFPNIFSKMNGDNVRAAAVRDVRMAANDFVANSLPEGNNFKELLKQQSNLYRAIERLAQNAAPTIDKSKFQRLVGLMRSHPILTVEAAGGLGAVAGAHLGIGASLAAALTSPVALGALLTYGTYRMGKTVLTSASVRNGLIKFLRATERTLAPEERAAVTTIINTLGESGKIDPRLAIIAGAGGAVGAGAWLANRGNKGENIFTKRKRELEEIDK
jgi:hypothetical protein